MLFIDLQEYIRMYPVRLHFHVTFSVGFALILRWNSNLYLLQLLKIVCTLNSFNENTQLKKFKI
jgi:hypothetical protein